MGYLYQRSPRILPQWEHGERKVPVPPPRPGLKPAGKLGYIVPAAIVLSGAWAMVYLSSAQHLTPWLKGGLFAFISLVMLLSLLYPVMLERGRRKRLAALEKERAAAYAEQLNELDRELTEERNGQLNKMLQVHGDFERCDSTVKRRSPSLWERSPQDADFLRLRVGTGRMKAAVVPRLEETAFPVKDELLEPARKLVDRSVYIQDAPVALPLADAAVTGIVASQGAASGVLRSLLVQLTTRHSPDEVLLSALFREDEATDWLWMRWLPHMWDERQTFRRMACGQDERRRLAEFLHDELQSRLTGGSGIGRTEGGAKPARHVVLLSAPDLLENDPLYGLLTEQGERAGVHTIVVARSVEALPRQCRLIVECEDDKGTYTLKKADGGTETVAFRLDRISPGQGEDFARHMSRIKLKRSLPASFPQEVPLLELLGTGGAEEGPAGEKWAGNRLPLSFPVMIGKRAGNKPFVLNLHDKLELGGQGPHGLIAGTTGSGKSELLQSIIAALAADFHPHDVAFLLIDYKGGGMSGIFQSLPHLTGSLTNLERKLVERAKTALRAELVARQNKLKAAGGLAHIDEYYKLGAPDGPLPHLFVIVDEFAELKRDFPDFIEELISVASIGRTLGLHLLLATQKPSGVVDEKIWSNARFRICLRVESEADSREMLKIPDAAFIKTSGRGFMQAGPEPAEEVQFAWAGAPCRDSSGDDEPAHQVWRVDLDGSKSALFSSELPELKLARVFSPVQPVVTQLEFLVRQLSRAAVGQGIPPLSGPWLEPLPEHLVLPELWLSAEEKEQDGLIAYVGLVDDVPGQRQYAAAVGLQEGHFALYGMPGSGKTTFLQTLLMSLLLHDKAGWQAYILDMGRMLQDFRELPQVGAVISADEPDRIARLFRHLRRTIAERRDKLAAAGIKNAEHFRGSFGQKLAEIIVLLDDYHLFRGSFPAEAEELDELLRLGGAAGIRFAITAGRYGDIPEKTRSLIAQTAALELADPADYYYAVGRIKHSGEMPRGRGYLKGARPLEFQTALPADGSGEYERADRLRAAISRFARHFQGEKAPRIPETPAKINLRELLPVGRYAGQEASSLPVPLAIEALDLAAVRVRLDSGPHFIVGAPAGGGKTALLASWILSLAWHHHPSKLQIYLVEARTPQAGSGSLAPLRALPHVRSCRSGEAGAKEVAELLLEDMRSAGSGGSDNGRVIRLLVIDDADILSRRLSDFAVKDKLTEIVRMGKEAGVHVLLSGNPADLPGFGADWITEVKACQTGFLLGTKDPADLAFFRIPIRESAAAQGELPVLPPGEGYFVDRKYMRIKAAVPYDKIWTPDIWISKVCDQWEISV